MLSISKVKPSAFTYIGRPSILPFDNPLSAHLHLKTRHYQATMASKDLYAIPGSEVPDFDVKGDISPTADMESQEKINHVEANMMPAQRRSNFYSMLAGGAGLLADGYQNSLASPPDV